MKMPDVNVLVYAINPDSLHHAPARRWLEQAFREPVGVGFAWNSLLGFLRLTTKRGVLPTTLSVEDALRFVDEWLSYPHAHILNPADNHATVLGRLLIGAGRGGNLVSDAHLAAIAIEHGAILGTFDADFERFAGLRFEHLAADAVHEDSLTRLKGSVLRFDDPLSPVDNGGHPNARPKRKRQKRFR